MVCRRSVGCRGRHSRAWSALIAPVCRTRLTALWAVRLVPLARAPCDDDPVHLRLADDADVPALAATLALAFADDPMQVRGGWAMDISELYAMAGVKPDDLDVVQTYDDYPVITMMQFEDLGFCNKGEGAAFVRQHDLTVDGDFPHNTSGGQLSAGQAGAAGAYLGLVEGLRQVLGEAGPTQVKDARLALASGFGMINYDRGLASGAAIFAGPAR